MNEKKKPEGDPAVTQRRRLAILNLVLALVAAVAVGPSACGSLTRTINERSECGEIAGRLTDDLLPFETGTVTAEQWPATTIALEKLQERLESANLEALGKPVASFKATTVTLVKARKTQRDFSARAKKWQTLVKAQIAVIKQDGPELLRIGRGYQDICANDTGAEDDCIALTKAVSTMPAPGYRLTPAKSVLRARQLRTVMTAMKEMPLSHDGMKKLVADHLVIIAKLATATDAVAAVGKTLDEDHEQHALNAARDERIATRTWREQLRGLRHYCNVPTPTEEEGTS